MPAPTIIARAAGEITGRPPVSGSIPVPPVASAAVAVAVAVAAAVAVAVVAAVAVGLAVAVAAGAVPGIMSPGTQRPEAEPGPS